MSARIGIAPEVGAHKVLPYDVPIVQWKKLYNPSALKSLLQLQQAFQRVKKVSFHENSTKYAVGALIIRRGMIATGNHRIGRFAALCNTPGNFANKIASPKAIIIYFLRKSQQLLRNCWAGDQ